MVDEIVGRVEVKGYRKKSSNDITSITLGLHATRARVKYRMVGYNPYENDPITNWKPSRYMKKGTRRPKRLRVKLKEAVAREAREIQTTARQYSAAAMKLAAEIMGDPTEPASARLQAIDLVLSRAYGKPNQNNTNLNIDANGKTEEISSTELTPELLRLSNDLKSLQDERQKRLRARNSLLTYASTIEIPTVPSHNSIDDDTDSEKFVPLPARFGQHHLLWLDCLQKVEDGSIKRLLGLLPPGSGKSIYTSVVFPTHFLGRFPKKSVILTSYDSDLPKKFGRRARSIVQQPVYRRIFDTTLSDDSAAADQWMLTNGSEWMGAGIMSGITGNRADGIIWDDPIKGREQAESNVIRTKTYDAYVDDLLTRKKPNAWEIGITTHWHQEDPAGRILPEDYSGESGWIDCRDGNKWYVVCIPAEAERSDDILGRKIGERIWPEEFPPDHFDSFKRIPRTWSSLYQQRPAPESGIYFELDWLKPWPGGKMPDREAMHVYGASDYAVTEDGGDYTVHVVVGIDNMDQMWLLDLWRQQTTPDKWIEALCNLIERWKPLGWAEEAGQIKSSVGPFLVKRLRERRLYIARKPFPSKSDKVIRAQSIRGRMAMNGLFCPFHATWFSAFKDELMKFNAGKYDDQVDLISLIGQVLDKMVRGRPTPPPEAKPKLFSTNPADCTVTMDDMWEANDKRQKSPRLFIH